MGAATFVGLAPDSKADPLLNLLPTTTVLTSSGNPSFSDTVTFTASVSILGALNVVPVTPGGNVVFTAVDQHTPDDDPIPLGTSAINACALPILGPCTATLTYTFPPVATNDYGQYVVTATYTGDLVAQPSQGSMIQDLTTTFDCVTSCSNSSRSGATRFEIDGAEGSEFHARIGFDSTPLSCTTPNTGDTAIWDTDYPDSKMVSLETSGAAAETAHAHGDDYICWSAPYNWGPSASEVSPGVWQGVLPLCGDEANPPPCVEYSYYYPGSTSGSESFPAYLYTYIFAPAGDPKSTR